MQVRDAHRSRRSIGLLAVVCSVLQLALAPSLALGAGRANIMLAFAALVALSEGGRTGVLVGFCAGLFYDLCTTGPLGLMTLLLTVLSYVLGTEERNRLADEPAAAFVMFAVSSGVALLVYHLTMLLMGQSDSLIDAIFLRTLPTYGLTLLAYFVIAYFYTRDTQSLGARASRATGSNLGGGLGRHARNNSLNIKKR